MMEAKFDLSKSQMRKLSRRSFMVQAPAALTVAATFDKLPAENSALHSQRENRSADAANANSSSPGPLPFTHQELFGREVRDTYEGQSLNQIAFPLGGIGTGCISLSGTGKLIDWEIFNNPNRGFYPDFSFLSIWAQEAGMKPVFKVLEGQLRGSLEGPRYIPGREDSLAFGNGEGPRQTQAAGLPRMRQCRFKGRFPFAEVELTDRSLPLAVSIEGWSPFIPLNSRDSSLPVAVLNVRLTNIGRSPVKAVLAMNVQNCAGDRNEMLLERGLSILLMQGEQSDGNAMFLATPAKVNHWQTNWKAGRDFPPLQHFVNTFAKNGQFDNSSASPGDGKATDAGSRTGSIGIDIDLEPKRSITVPLVLGWYFPVFDTATNDEMVPGTKPWRNYYGTQWKSGLEVARYTISHLKRLEADTRVFQDNFFSSTVPGVILEAASSQLAILRSPTIIRYPNGDLYGWEGCAINHRTGYGTVNHVWNYQQSIPYLFPDLQRSILNNFFFNGMRESDGAIQYRMPAGPGAKAGDMPPQSHNGKANFYPAADGQFGLITQVYRDWQIAGDTEWLANIWPRVKKAMEYTWTTWDTRREGLLTGEHHCTLDIEFTSPEPMCGSQYLAALLACEKMSQAMQDEDFSKDCRRIFESGKILTDQQLFNGSYYQQRTPSPGESQLDSGCISELVNGQLYARMLGLDDVYSPEKLRISLKSLFGSNYRDSFDDVINVDRVYSLNDDRGLQIATWPKGGKPEMPLLYCDETWCGSEYQAAFNMIYAGLLEEGLTLVRSVRDRHDGKKRNPFCEFEYGNHYTRSLIAYAGILAISQFRYSAVEKLIQLAPVVSRNNFQVFFSVASGWGIISQKRTKTTQTLDVSISQGNLIVRRFQLESDHRLKNVVADIAGSRVSGTIAPAKSSCPALHAIQMEKEITVKPGNLLSLKMTV